MKQLFTDRKFHFCYHRNFWVFFVNGKRPKFPKFQTGIFVEWKAPLVHLKRGPFFRNVSGWTKLIYWVLDRNFRKFWLNGSRNEIVGRYFMYGDRCLYRWTKQRGLWERDWRGRRKSQQKLQNMRLRKGKTGLSSMTLVWLMQIAGWSARFLFPESSRKDRSDSASRVE